MVTCLISSRFIGTQDRIKTNLKRTVLIILTIYLNLTGSPVFAGAGDLDPTFGDGGLVTTDIGGNYDDGSIGKTLVQPDGKIIAAAGSGGFHLLRFFPDGTLDESFGEGGQLTFSNPTIAEFNWRIGDFTLLPDGKILVAGNLQTLTDLGTYAIDFLLARFNADGSADTSFGNNGSVTTDFSDRYGTETLDSLNRFVVRDDGTIIGVVTNYLRDSDPSENYTIIVRYSAEGDRDLSFGDGGIVEFGHSLGFSRQEARDLVLQPDGKFLVNGVGTDLSPPRYLVRYNLNGDIDTSFGVDGVVSYLNFDKLYIQSDGKIYGFGYASYYPDPGCGFGIQRLNEDGSLDLTFGDAGRVITDFGCVRFPAPPPSIWSSANAITVKPDGKIVAFGDIVTSLSPGETYYDFALAQYNPDGSLDQAFGDGGKLITEFESRQSRAASLLIQPEGKILAFGNLTTYPIDPDYFPYRNPIAVRYIGDGSIDASFGTDGIVTIPVHWTTDDDANDIVSMQGDGKIIVGGSTSRVYDCDFALVRYKQDGSIDTTFGQGGFVITDFSLNQPESATVSSTWTNDYISAIRIQPDGKIVALGRSTTQGSGGGCSDDYRMLAMARYLPDGTLDETFGTGGKIVRDIGGEFGSGSGTFRDLALQPNGDIVIAGSVSGLGFTVIRLKPDGTFDETFGNGGLAWIDPFNLPGFQYLEALYDVALQPDGKIVAAGIFAIWWPLGYSHLDRWNILRFNPDGSLDSSFNPSGGGGVVNAFLGPVLGPSLGDLALQSDGKILVTGWATTDDPNRDGGGTFTVLRYLPDGSPDTAFGINGKAQADFDQLFGDVTVSGAQSITLQADGQIVVAGDVSYWIESVGSNLDFGLVRFNTDGSPDYSFGIGGKVTTEFGSKEDHGKAVTIQADGKILVAGSSSQRFKGLGVEIAIARYEGVSTRIDELEGLVVRVQDLKTAEILNQGQTNSLQVKLQGAIQQYDSGKFGSAINKLEAFINHVDAFVSGGILSSNQGQVLKDEAQGLIFLLSN